MVGIFLLSLDSPEYIKIRFRSPFAYCFPYCHVLYRKKKIFVVGVFFLKKTKQKQTLKQTLQKTEQISNEITMVNAGVIWILIAVQ